MRQPTNLRGATLPGLSQPSEKEGPHHRSLRLPRLQRQAGSFSLRSWGARHLRLWKATRKKKQKKKLFHSLDDGATLMPHLRASKRVEQWQGRSPVPHRTWSVYSGCDVRLTGWHCWLNRVSVSVWYGCYWVRSLTFEPGRRYYCGLRGGSHQSQQPGTRGAETNLAGDHWPGSEIPQPCHHFLSSRLPVGPLLKMRAAEAAFNES